MDTRGAEEPEAPFAAGFSHSFMSLCGGDKPQEKILPLRSSLKRGTHSTGASIGSLFYNLQNCFQPNLSLLGTDQPLQEVELLVDLRTLREADKALESALPLSCKVQLLKSLEFNSPSPAENRLPLKQAQQHRRVRQEQATVMMREQMVQASRRISGVLMSSIFLKPAVEKAVLAGHG